MNAAFVPHPTPVSEPFFAAAARGELSVQFCAVCERFYFVPRSFCPRCWSDDVRWRVLSGRGTLASYVIVARPTPGVYEDAPYVVAAVALAEGVRMMANLVGVPAEPSALVLDMELAVSFAARGELTVPVFGPAPDAPGASDAPDAAGGTGAPGAPG